MSAGSPSEKALATGRFGLGPAGGEDRPKASSSLAEVKAEIGRASTLLQPPGPLHDSRTILLAMGQAEQRDQRRRLAEKAGQAPPTEPPLPPDSLVRVDANGLSAGATARAFDVAERAARFRHAISTEVPFVERLVMFWSNHFCIARDKAPRVKALAGAFEREAIRPFVLGRFADMQWAVATHPAMLLYLDNVQSIGPNSVVGKRRGIGLNENLAREILELHTLGVDGGYTQADVTSLARILTGWAILVDVRRKPGFGGSRFFAIRHEPGAHALMGQVFHQKGGDQAEAALRFVATHPATARHIATKLARAFVADDPPPSLVSRLDETFRRTDGDLAALAEALIDAPESRGPFAKFRKPFEFLVAAGRSFGDVATMPQVDAALLAMGEPLWAPSSPAGHSDLAGVWTSPETLKVRMDVAQAIAGRSKIDDPLRFADAVFGPDLSAETRQAVARAESAAQALALLLMSPEFQRR